MKNIPSQAEHFDDADWQTLHALSTALLRPLPLAEKLDHVLATVANFHAAKHGVISILDETTGSLVVKASLGMGASARAGIANVQIGSGACGRAFARRERVIIEDFENASQFSEFLPWAREHKIGAVYSTPFFDSTGETLGVLSLYFEAPHRPTAREMRLADICAGTVALFLDRDQTEDSLRRERDRRSEILFNMAEGLCVLNHDFIVIEMNTAALHMCRQPGWEVLGKNYWELWPEVKEMELGERLTRAMADRTQMHLENRWVAPGGDVVWFDVNAQPVVEGMAIYFRDVTERKLAEERVLMSEVRYRVLTQTLSEIIWRCDEKTLGFQNIANWKEFTGQSDEDSAGSGWLNALHIDDREQTAERLRLAKHNGAKFETEYRLRRRDGVYRLMRSVAAPVYSGDGSIKEWIGSCEDITDRQNQQNQLVTSNRRKEEFLAVLSHELRGPLSAAKLAATILERPGLDGAKTAQVGQVIGRQIGHMSRLVEDLVDISRISQGLVTLQQTRVDLSDVVNDAIEQVLPMITAKKHNLSLRKADSCVVCSDKTRLVQIVSNLLSNAARYTPDNGQISVYVENCGDACRVKVVDNGIGIAACFMPTLFDLFAQAERSDDRRNGGLGLGLALVKNLVELHGGRVHALSDGEHLGSTFSIVLPKVET